MRFRFFFLALTIMLFANTGWSGEQAASGSVRVYYSGNDPALRERLFLEQGFKSVDTVDAAEVIVIHNFNVQDALRSEIVQAVHSGKGLLILMGPEIDAGFLSELYGETVELLKRDNAITVNFYQPTPSFWGDLWNIIRRKEQISEPHWSRTGKVDWKSLPQAYDRLALIKSPRAGKTLLMDDSGKEGILHEGKVGQGRGYLWTLWFHIDPQASLSRKENKNYQIICWPFYNYLLYGMVMEAAGKTPLRFTDWASSPTFQPRTKKIIGTGIGLFALANLTVFFLVRRWSLRNRTPLEGFAKFVWKHDTFNQASSRNANHWQDAGFYRPLSGFLISFLLTTAQTIVLIPVGIWVANNLEIFPFLRGLNNMIWGVLGVIFFLFDLDTAIAAVKFYSEYRAKDPERAIQYFQLMIWWEILTGLIQIILMTLAAFYLMPQTVWAYLALAFICYVVATQWPGLNDLFIFVFLSYQRFDYVQYQRFINIGINAILGPLLLYLWRMWGVEHPKFGEAFTYVFFVASFSFLTQGTNFFTGYFFYRRLGYPLRVLFMAHFNFAIIRQALNYGYKLTIRQIITKVDDLLWVVILSIVLTNYLETIAIIGVAIGAFASFSILDTIHITICPSFSEAYSQKRLNLSRHYIIHSLHWGFFCSVLIGFIVLTLTGPISSMLNPQWSRVGAVLPLVFCSSIFSFFAQMPDSIFMASGRTGFVPLVAGICLIIKVIFLFLLVPSMQISGPPIVLIIVSVTDVIVSWLIVGRYILRLNINPLRMALPHLLAGVIITLLLMGLRWLLVPWGWPGLTALIIISIIMEVPYIFLTAILGGWNEMTVDEFERACQANRFTAILCLWAVKIIHRAKKYQWLPDYQPEDQAAVQAEADQVVAARTSEEMREALTGTLKTMGSWRESMREAASSSINS